ncbi:hypothetical protein JCM8097_004741 [Rhodosporidiobolus ruineniae]
MTTPLTNEQLDALSHQELVDYLCTAVEELDVLYVEIWLRRLKQRGVQDAVTRKHSWKDSSAFALVGSAQHTPLRELVFLLLVFRLPPISAVRQVFSRFDLQSWAHSTVDCRFNREIRPAAYQTAVRISSCGDEQALEKLLDELAKEGKLPDQPDPSTFTGCNPLPPRPLDAFGPPPSSDSSRSSISLLSSPPAGPAAAFPAALPSAGPSSAASSAPSTKLRIAPVPAELSLSALEALLGSLDGLCGVELSAPSAAVLTFRNQIDAERARQALGGMQLGPSNVVATTISTPRAHLPPPLPPLHHPRPVKLSTANSWPSTATQAAPRPRFPLDHAFSLRIFNLARGVSPEAVFSLFYQHGIKIKRSSFRFGPAHDAYVTVPNRLACQLALDLLPGSILSGTSTARQVEVERDRPDYGASDEAKQSHPKVVLSGLDRHTSDSEVRRLAQSTQCGMYGARTGASTLVVGPAGATVSKEASFRTSSPFAAEQAVRALDGTHFGGRCIRARWVHMGEAAEEEKQREEAEYGEREMEIEASSETEETAEETADGPAGVEIEVDSPVSSLRLDDTFGPPSSKRPPSPVQLPSPLPRSFPEILPGSHQHSLFPVAHGRPTRLRDPLSANCDDRQPSAPTTLYPSSSAKRAAEAQLAESVAGGGAGAARKKKRRTVSFAE